MGGTRVPAANEDAKAASIPSRVKKMFLSMCTKKRSPGVSDL